jgi:hypothetical protein
LTFSARQEYDCFANALSRAGRFVVGENSETP